MDVRDPYEGMGEFHDLFMDDAWTRLQPVLTGAFADLGDSDTVLDLGAGTGLGTRVLAASTPARIVAVEPSLTMRAVLTARVADDPELSRRVSIVGDRLPEALDAVDGPVAGFLCAHVLGHLSGGDRRTTFLRLAGLLGPTAVGVVTTTPAAAAPPPAREEVRAIGAFEYVARHLPPGGDRTSVSEYEVRRGERAIRRYRFTATWDPPTDDQLRAELADAGLSLQPTGMTTALVRRTPVSVPGDL